VQKPIERKQATIQKIKNAPSLRSGIGACQESLKTFWRIAQAFLIEEAAFKGEKGGRDQPGPPTYKRSSMKISNQGRHQNGQAQKYRHEKKSCEGSTPSRQSLITTVTTFANSREYESDGSLHHYYGKRCITTEADGSVPWANFGGPKGMEIVAGDPHARQMKKANDGGGRV